MSVLTRIAPGSAFKVGLAIYGVLGLIAGITCALAAWLVPAIAHVPLGRGLAALSALVVCPIVYGILGGIVAAVGALLYNFAAGCLGGLEVEWK